MTSNHKQAWEMNGKEFGNRHYLLKVDIDDEGGFSRIKNEGITNGTLFLARNQYNIEQAQRSVGFDKYGYPKGGHFFIVSSGSIPPSLLRYDGEGSVASGLPDRITISQEHGLTIPYITGVPCGLDPHEYVVYEALGQGKSVPEDVLEEHPHLTVGDPKTEGLLPDLFRRKAEKSIREPWRVGRDEFGENFYLHGSPEPYDRQIREAGGVTKGTFIRAKDDKNLNVTTAYATDAEKNSGFYGRNGIGTKSGTTFVSNIYDIFTPEQMAARISRIVGRYGRSIINFDHILELLFSSDGLYDEIKTVPYVAEIPVPTYVVDAHKYLVMKAIRQQNDVPEEVLEDYPNIEEELYKDGND